MQKQINATSLTIIPKNNTPTSLNDYRPIACCTVLYKIISKILTARLSTILPRLINPAQAAFVAGRSIVDNVLLAHELLRNYHRKSKKKNCALKIDLRKAYDSIHWDFLEEMLLGLNFPSKFITWIMSCIRTCSFTLLINGSAGGFFDAKRGLRQGDPLSPLLFVLCMEYLSRAFAANLPTDFQFHSGCKDPKIVHLSFADDLLIFSSCRLTSVQFISNILTHFSEVSGMKVNEGKSAIFFAGTNDEVKNDILSLLRFKEGRLPITYLGVPLISSALKREHCAL